MLEVEDQLERPQSVSQSVSLAESEGDKNSPASHVPGVVWRYLTEVSSVRRSSPQLAVTCYKYLITTSEIKKHHSRYFSTQLLLVVKRFSQ